MIEFTSDTSLKERAQYFARSQGLESALVCAVIEQESGWSTWAMRYEPAFFIRYVASQVNLSDTERQARATSWGLMQVMGQVARERGFGQKFLSSLCDPDFGLAVGCEYLKHILDGHGGDVANALQRWNGGANPDYAQEVMARMSKYQ